MVIKICQKTCRVENDWGDGISTVSHDKVSSPKRMQSESDDKTSTVSNEDIFSSSHEDESPEEMNDSDEDYPWGVLIHKVAAEFRTKHNELTKKQAFSEILPELRKELGNI